MNFHTLVRKNGSLKTGRTHTHTRAKKSTYFLQKTRPFSLLTTLTFFLPRLLRLIHWKAFEPRAILFECN